MATYKIGGSLDLIDISPYRQILSYTKPEAYLMGKAANIDLTLAGEYSLKFLELTFKSTYNLAQLSKSFADFIEAWATTGTPDYTLIIPAVADFEVDADNEVEIEEDLLAWSPIDSAVSTWYGDVEIWTTTFTLV